MKKKKRLRRFLIVFLVVVILAAVSPFAVSGYVKGSVKDRILTPEAAADISDVDCVIVLGCFVREDGTLSDMLHDRLKQGVAVYNGGAAPKLLMSGDHGRVEYNEVGAMKQYAIDQGIPSEHVFMDHAGFSTYETMYRAKAIFGADKVIVVTQQYHLYRALYIADQLGIEAYGVSADLRPYSGQTGRDLREVLARCKDFMMCIVKPKPTYLGETIPVSGSGDLTND